MNIKLHIKFLHAIIVIAFLFSVFSSCSSDSEKLNKSAVENETQDTTTHDLKNYYYPLSENMDTLIYKYAVTKKDKDGLKKSFEYLVWTRNTEGDFVCKVIDENNVLTDSSVYCIKNDGVHFKIYNFRTIDGSFVKTEVYPSLMFEWKRTKIVNNRNQFIFSYNFEGELIEADWRLENNFIGIEKIDNSVSDESECAHFKIYSELKLKKPEKGDTANFFLHADLYDLKGVGFYKSIKKNIYGSEEKILVEIIKK